MPEYGQKYTYPCIDTNEEGLTPAVESWTESATKDFDKVHKESDFWNYANPFTGALVDSTGAVVIDVYSTVVLPTDL